MKKSDGTADDFLTSTGVSGLAGDLCLVNPSTGMGLSGGYSPGPETSNPALASFTVTGWYNANSILQNGARIISFSGSGSGIEIGSTVGGQITLGINGNMFSTYVVSSGSPSTTSTYASVNSWVFFAISYDGTTNQDNVKFYAGTSSQDAVLVRTATLGAGSVVSNSSPFTIGNTTNGFGRSFDGSIDDVRLFGDSVNADGVLDLEQILTIQEADRTNQAIPEPASAWLIGIVAVLYLLTKKDRFVKKR
jgi:hypothetical protein